MKVAFDSFSLFGVMFYMSCVLGTNVLIDSKSIPRVILLTPAQLEATEANTLLALSPTAPCLVPLLTCRTSQWDLST